MNDQNDPEATPRPLQLTKYADVADRTPYIPRRKSSVDRRYGSSYHDISASMVLEPPQKPLHVWQKRHHSIKTSRMSNEERRLSKASRSGVRVPSEMYQDVWFPAHGLSTSTWLTLFQTSARSHQGLPYHDQSSISSYESRNRRRLFSRIISSFSHSSNSTRAISTLAKSLKTGEGQMPRLSGSTARDSSSRTTSMESTESTRSAETSMVEFDQSRTNSTNKPSSPNPLRTPPLALLRERDEMQHQHSNHRPSSTPSPPDETPLPALATATLLSASDVTKADVEKAATVWIAVDVECDVHYAENSTSSLRSKALGPPHTDPGFMSKLSLELIPASGCRILRLVGADSRDFLLPGETWSIVAQVCAEPPVRRKQAVKAFSLQNRPSSQALMDQLHTMLSPSGPSSQDLVHVSVTFEHALLPANVQCRVSENLSIERVSAWTLDSRPQYLRHRQSPRKAARPGPDQQHRDDIARKLLDILESTIHHHHNISSTETTTGHCEAIDILEDFFFDQPTTRPTSTPTHLLQRARDLLHALDAKIHPQHVSARAPLPASPIRRRRNGIDLPRERERERQHAPSQLQLRDITNQWSNPNPSPHPHPSPTKVVAPTSGLRAPCSRNVVITPAPAPLFSAQACQRRGSAAEIWWWECECQSEQERRQQPS